MTNEQINAAIALHLGWTGIVSDPCLGVMGIPPAKNDVDPVFIRNATWTNDLNAMHEAEKVLAPKNWNNFSKNWWVYCKLLRVNDADKAIHATARQRAEAFLRTLGKWEEAQG